MVGTFEAGSFPSAFPDTCVLKGSMATLPGEETLTRGRVVFAKPGRMRWVYESPEPSLVVSDGETLWIYDPAAREAQRLPVTQGYLTGAALAATPFARLELTGEWVALIILVTLIAGLVVSLRAFWARTVVRVLGSWIAATGLLLIGWSFRTGS